MEAIRMRLKYQGNKTKWKSMHSAFFNKTVLRDARSWEWLRTGDRKIASEGKIMAVQEQEIRARMIRHTIDKENRSPPPPSAECVENGMRQ